jgi:hypothetical protein
MTAPGKMVCPIHNVEEPRTQVYMEQVQELESTGALSYEVTGEEDQGPRVLSDEQVTPKDFMDAMRYHNGEKYKATFVPRLAVEEAEHATRAQTATQFEGPLTENIHGLLTDFGHVIVEQGARRLIEVNFGDVGDYGTWQYEELRPDESQKLAEVVFRLATSGAVVPTPADEAKIRAALSDYYVDYKQAHGKEPESQEASSRPERLPGYGA